MFIKGFYEVRLTVGGPDVPGGGWGLGSSTPNWESTYLIASAVRAGSFS